MSRTNRGNKIRSVEFEVNYLPSPKGSVLIKQGNTKVLCCANMNENVPPFLRGTGTGWLNAEYAMLPWSTHERISRESVRGKQQGRTMEIQRLIGRSLRNCLDFKVLGEKTFTIDCDVIQADGGTRTAAITGGFLALRLAVNKLLAAGTLKVDPIISHVAAVSVGIVNGEPLLDLNFEEDYKAEVDTNVVMNDKGEYLEIQGSAEERPFTHRQLNKMLELAGSGIIELIELQKLALKGE